MFAYVSEKIDGRSNLNWAAYSLGCFNFFLTRPAFACGFYVRFLFQIPNLINIGHLQTCHGPGLFLGLFYGICWISCSSCKKRLAQSKLRVTNTRLKTPKTADVLIHQPNSVLTSVWSSNAMRYENKNIAKREQCLSPPWQVCKWPMLIKFGIWNKKRT